MHPLQSFSGVAVPSLEGRVFAIEGQTQAVRVARRIARELGGSPVRVAGDKKLLYHAAAAMAAGHILAVEEAATQLLVRSEEHTSELQSQSNLVCRLLLEKNKQRYNVL